MQLFAALDRATNDIEGDALNAKQIAKVTITGAADGVVNAATAGMFEGITSAGQTVKQAAVKGIKAGAISGAASYTTEAVFEEDVDFDIEGLITLTAQNAAAGAVFGGITGGITGGLKQNSLNKKVNSSIENAVNPAETPDTRITKLL